MNKKSKIISSAVFVILIIGFFVLYKTLQVSENPVHYHANFAVFIDGKEQDFSGDKFMHIEPCSDEEEEHLEDLDERVHLHDNMGNVVHVHDTNVRWEDLFKNLNYKIKGKNIRFYINGKEEKYGLQKIIQSNDKVLIAIGENKDLDKEFEAVGSDVADYNSGKKTVESCGSSNKKRTFFQRFKIAFPGVFR